MGQAPATDKISLRTVPRNFPGRSGTKEDQVYLCSPETATASALKGEITDPRDLGKNYPEFKPALKINLIENITYPPKPGKIMKLSEGLISSPYPTLTNYQIKLKVCTAQNEK